MSNEPVAPAARWHALHDAGVRHFAADRSWLAFYHRGFSGLVFWGHVDAASLRELGALVPLRFSAQVRPHASLIDVRLVRSVDPEALELRNQLIELHRATASQFVTRCAVVYEPGLAAAISIGVRALCPAPFSEGFFNDSAEALRWLGREDQAPVLAEVERLRVEVSGDTRDVRELRHLLDADLKLSLETAARALALSTRSLQRRLADAGTSFQAEVAQATVRAAQRLLRDGRASITGVAFEVGCSSPQHLSTLFRRAIGETPSAWRARHAA